MFWGFLATGAALLVMLVWSLVEIRRIDRIIAGVDRRLGRRTEK
jgi:hypothetical protein